MMHRILFFALFILFASSVRAQIIKNIGLQGGLTHSNFFWDYQVNSNRQPDEFEDSYAVGFNINVFADVIFKKNWSLETSIGFIRKISDHTDQTMYSRYDEQRYYKLNYLTFAPNFKYHIPLSSTINLLGALGPRIDLLLYYSEELNLIYHYELWYPPRDEDFRNFVFGFNLGIGIQKIINDFSFVLNTLYMPSLTNAFDVVGPRLDNLGDDGFYLKMRDKSFALNLGVSYRFTKNL